MGSSSIKWYLNHLFGRKIIILGNHDKNEKVFKGLTEAVYDGFVNIKIKDEDVKEGYQRITLCHYPMLSWYQSHRGACQFYGHWHNNTLANFKGKMRTDDDEVMDFIKAEHKSAEYLKNIQYDVGVDGNDFTPVSYNSIKNFITKLSYKK
jgi:calcineurin-like phosphoesterase family protein